MENKKAINATYGQGALEEPSIITCGQCGGDLHVLPIKEDCGDGTFRIVTLNICGKCTFKKQKAENK